MQYYSDCRRFRSNCVIVLVDISNSILFVYLTIILSKCLIKKVFITKSDGYQWLFPVRRLKILCLYHFTLDAIYSNYTDVCALLPQIDILEKHSNFCAEQAYIWTCFIYNAFWKVLFYCQTIVTRKSHCCTPVKCLRCKMETNSLSILRWCINITYPKY